MPVDNSDYDVVVETAAGQRNLSEELRAAVAENKALREIIDKIANHDWIISLDYDPARSGEEWHWRVNVRDEPTKSRRGATQTYSRTEYRGRSPATAGLAALSTAAHPRDGDEENRKETSTTA